MALEKRNNSSQQINANANKGDKGSKTIGQSMEKKSQEDPGLKMKL